MGYRDSSSNEPSMPDDELNAILDEYPQEAGLTVKLEPIKPTEPPGLSQPPADAVVVVDNRLELAKKELFRQLSSPQFTIVGRSRTKLPAFLLNEQRLAYGLDEQDLANLGVWMRESFRHVFMYEEIQAGLRYVREQPDWITDASRLTDSGLPTYPRKLKVAPLSAFPVKQVQYLWKDRLEQNALNLIAGDPGTLKTFFLCYVAARVSTGMSWPDGAGPAPKGKVLFITSENDPNVALRPRVENAGGDLNNVFFMDVMTQVTEGVETESGFKLDVDLEELRGWINENHPLLVIIDPLTSFVSSQRNMNNGNEIRDVLDPVHKLAQETGTCIIVIHHSRKGNDLKAVDSICGSRQLTGGPRVVWQAIRDLKAAKIQDDDGNVTPENENRVNLAAVKINNFKPAPTLSYSLVHQDGKAVLVFNTALVNKTADELMREQAEELSGGSVKAGGGMTTLADELKALLETGPQALNDLMFQLHIEPSDSGFRRIRRAAELVTGISHKRIGFGPNSFSVWGLGKWQDQLAVDDPWRLGKPRPEDLAAGEITGSSDAGTAPENDGGA